MTDGTLPLFPEGNTSYAGRSFDAEILQGLQMKGAELDETEFYRCTFVGCDLTDASLDRTRFERCVFEACNLSNARLGKCSFLDVEFKVTKLLGVNWTTATRPLSISFEGCQLDYCGFVGLSLRKTRFDECSVREANFSDADLTSAKLTRCDFAGTRFLHTNLSFADFTGATNYSIDPTQNRLKKTVFSLPEAVSLLSYFDVILK